MSRPDVRRGHGHPNVLPRGRILAEDLNHLLGLVVGDVLELEGWHHVVDASILELVRGVVAMHLEGEDGLRLCAPKLEVRPLDVNLTLAGNFEIGIHYVVDEAADEAGVDPGVVLGVDRVRSTDNVASYAALLLGVGLRCFALG